MQLECPRAPHVAKAKRGLNACGCPWDRLRTLALRAWEGLPRHKGDEGLRNRGSLFRVTKPSPLEFLPVQGLNLQAALALDDLMRSEEHYLTYAAPAAATAPAHLGLLNLETQFDDACSTGRSA